LIKRLQDVIEMFLKMCPAEDGKLSIKTFFEVSTVLIEKKL